MNNKDIAEVYKITPYGAPVIVWGGPYGNFGNYLRELKPGMRGSDVYQLQQLLAEQGYYKAVPDGIYGEYFKQVVHEYQKAVKLPITDTLTSTFYYRLGVFLMD